RLYASHLPSGRPCPVSSGAISRCKPCICYAKNAPICYAKNAPGSTPPSTQALPGPRPATGNHPCTVTSRLKRPFCSSVSEARGRRGASSPSWQAVMTRACFVLHQPPLHEDRNDQDDI